MTPNEKIPSAIPRPANQCKGDPVHDGEHTICSYCGTMPDPGVYCVVLKNEEDAPNPFCTEQLQDWLRSVQNRTYIDPVPADLDPNLIQAVQSVFLYAQTRFHPDRSNGAIGHGWAGSESYEALLFLRNQLGKMVDVCEAVQTFHPDFVEMNGEDPDPHGVLPHDWEPIDPVLC